MQTFQPPDTHYLSACIGWLELGNHAEAKAELAQVSPAQQNHPEVLELRWAICAEEQDWQEGLSISQLMLANYPQRASGWLHQAYALRRVPGGTVNQAWEALLPAAAQFPDDPIFPYNLSCYACQMEQLERAREWFKKAMCVGKKEQIKKMALSDPDLTSLWEEIKEW